MDFDELIEEALEAHFSGWDFSYLNGRVTKIDIPWDYAAIVRQQMEQAQSMLDMGTGGGELLASLAPFPPRTVATEGYAPNVPIAKARLEPLGIQVFAVTGDEENESLPFEDASFDLVINRHEAYTPREVGRVLKPGGRFITQQVGWNDNVALGEWLQAEEFEVEEWWMAAYAAEELAAADFKILSTNEAFLPSTFLDIGAVVYYLRAIPWQIEDFNVIEYREQLLEMHRHIEDNEGLTTICHRFIIEAQKETA